MKLPSWVEKAFAETAPVNIAFTDHPPPEGVKRHETLCSRIKCQWTTLERDLLPNIENHTDEAKQALFENAIWVFKKFTEEKFKALHEAKKELQTLHPLISEQAIELAKNLRRISEIQEEQVSLDLQTSSLWSLIRESAERYPAWEMCAETKMNDFLRIARGQSREGPELADLLETLNSNISSEEIHFDLGSITKGRSNSQSNQIRAMIMAIEALQPRKKGEELGAVFPHLWVRQPIKINNEGIAALVSVIFDQEIDGQNVKSAKRSLKGVKSPQNFF